MTSEVLHHLRHFKQATFFRIYVASETSTFTLICTQLNYDWSEHLILECWEEGFTDAILNIILKF